jgi:steroid delta-isomerase-like uncharacterized protein
LLTSGSDGGALPETGLQRHFAIGEKSAPTLCGTVGIHEISPLAQEVEEMSVTDNKQIICDYVAAWNRGDLESMSQFWDKGMIHHARERSHNFAAVQKIVADFMAAFPDLQFNILDIFGEGDRVLTRMTARGTHRGCYLGHPPTHKKIECGVMGVSRLANGKIVEHWGVTDELAMMGQLGMLPAEYLEAMA